MSRILAILILGLSFAALADSEGAQKVEKKDTAGVILEHVSDSNEIELENPLAQWVGPEVFVKWQPPVWRIPFHEGACPADDETEASLSQGCLDISLTKHSFMLLVAGAVLTAILMLGSHRSKKSLVPQGTMANIIELLVLFVRNEIAIPNIGKKEGPRYTGYLLSAFFFILAANLLGLIPGLSTATGNVAVTGGLAICTFFLTQVASFRSAGFVGYFKHLTGGAPWWLVWLMVPIEIIGMFTKPFALTMRLFANMLAGHIVLFSFLGLIFMLHWAVAPISVFFAVCLSLLELFVAFLQAYVFTLLSAVFIGMGVAMGHHDDHEGGHGEGVGAAH
jgi:F-type H+-transporting ATPase subunit a